MTATCPCGNTWELREAHVQRRSDGTCAVHCPRCDRMQTVESACREEDR